MAIGSGSNASTKKPFSKKSFVNSPTLAPQSITYDPLFKLPKAILNSAKAFFFSRFSTYFQSPKKIPLNYK